MFPRRGRRDPPDPEEDPLVLAYRHCRKVWGAFLQAAMRKDVLVSVGRDLALTPAQQVEHQARLSEVEAYLTDLDAQIARHEGLVRDLTAQESRAALGPLFSPPRTGARKKMLTG